VSERAVIHLAVVFEVEARDRGRGGRLPIPKTRVLEPSCS
jgi:hypothetical protein